MKDRLITAAGALASCLIVYSLFFQAGGQAEFTRPQSAERGRNGYLALATWLEQVDVDVVSWRERFDSLLGAEALPESGNIMLTTLPHHHALRDVEEQQLLGWIRRGNTLLIMAALNDSPEWLATVTSGSWLDDLGSLVGMGFRPRPADGSEASRIRPPTGPEIAAGQTVVFSPASHPLMEGVRRLEARSDGPSSIWVADLPPGTGSTDPVMRLARASAFEVDAVWQRRVGDGQVLLVASASLFTNLQIDEADNARFLANIVRRHLAPGAAFVFDDMHQGITSLYDPEAFYADSRLHATIAFLIAGWLIYLLGSSNRLAPPAKPRTEPRQADFLAAIGGFMARRLARRDTGMMMFEEWFNEIRRDRGLPEGSEPPWDALAATPALSRNLLTRLHDCHERLADGHSVDLVALNNLLRRSREAIG